MVKMNLVVLVLTAAMALLSTEAAPTPSEKFMHSMLLDESGNYTLFWKFDSKSITFEAHVRTTGWVGFGISPNGGMTDSDVVIGWVASDGKAHLKDRYATAFMMPIIDPHQDWFLISGREEAGYTVLKFYRALDTKDCVFDRVISQDTLRVIWAFKDQDPSNHTDIVYHGATTRGSKSVNLLEPTPNREHPDLASALSTTVANVAARVPSAMRTMYYCQVVKAPTLTQRHHIIKYAPLIQKESMGVVHHLVVHGCYHPNPDLFIGISEPCIDGAMPMDLQPFAVWAVGGEDFYFPDEVGFSIGGPGDPNIFVLETHFDNPELKSGIIDNSGIILWYTPVLRRYDASVLIVGNDISPMMAIPPGASQYTISGICHSNCTSAAIPEEGVTIFGNQLHAHLLGRKIRIRQFRGDKQIGELGRDDNYDFNYQQNRILSPSRIVKPGDTIVTECTYDSTSRQNVTFGGLQTTEEMCNSFVYYYPKVNLKFCASEVNAVDLLKALNQPHLNSFTQNTTISVEDYTNAMNSINWSPSLIGNLQKAQTKSKMIYTCVSGDDPTITPVTNSMFPVHLKYTPDVEPVCLPSTASIHSAGRVAIWLSLVVLIVAMLRDRSI